MANLDIQLTAMLGHQLVQVPTEVPLTILIDGAFGQATHVAIPDTSVVCLVDCFALFWFVYLFIICLFVCSLLVVVAVVVVVVGNVFAVALLVIVVRWVVIVFHASGFF